MQCPNCEAENRDDAKFCDECGFPLAGAMSHAAAGAPTPAQSVPASAADDVLAAPAERQDALPGSANGSRGDADFADEGAYGRENAVAASPEPGILEQDDRSFDSGVTKSISPAGPQHGDPEGQAAFEEADPDGSQASPQEAQVPADESRFAGFSTHSDDGFGFFPDDPVSEPSYADYSGQPSDSTMQMPRVGGDSAPASRDFRISSNAKRRPPKAVFAIVAVVAVAMIAIGVAFALGLWGGVAVPDVTGMTENDARSVLEGEGFSVRSTQVKSDDTEGLVLIMDPAGGSRAAEGSEVVIHIATARFIPDIVGKSYEEAKSLLEEAGYENVRYDKVKSEDAEDVVLSVSPEPGTRAKSSMEVVVGVSEAYRVPDIAGLDLDSAEAAITDGGLVAQVVYVDTQEYPEGTILGTTPEANTKVSEGDYVSINVARARGAELVSLTEGLLAPGDTATIGGTSIAIDSVDSVSYLGDDTVSFKITGRPFATLMGETVYGTAQSVEGQVVWSEDNEVVSIS